MKYTTVLYRCYATQGNNVLVGDNDNDDNHIGWDMIMYFKLCICKLFWEIKTAQISVDNNENQLRIINIRAYSSLKIDFST